MTSANERRSHPRVPSHIRTALYHRGEVHQGVILDYSESGVFVASDVPVHEGEILLLRFRRPEDAAVVQIQGMVMRLVVPGESSHEGFGARLFELLSTVSTVEGGSGIIPAVEGPDLPVPPTAADDSGGSGFRARDSRKVHRIAATYYPAGLGAEPHTGQVLNVSRKGLLLQSSESPKKGSLLKVELDGQDVDGSPAPLRLDVLVAWSGPRGSAEADGIGCRLLGCREQDGWARWNGLLRSLLLIGNPMFRRTGDDE